MKLPEFIIAKNSNLKQGCFIEENILDTKISEKDLAVGIELEIERAGLINPLTFKNLPFWEVVIITEDGSLKIDGREIISPPMYSGALTLFLAELRNVYKNHPEFLFSHRTSIHVHVDASQLEVEAIPSMIAIMMVLEPLFFRFNNVERECNPFCVPLADSHITRQMLRQMPGLNITLGMFKQDSFKYFAFNLSTLFKYNTIEFRHCEGHNDVTRLEKWINLCKTFIQFFSREEVIKELPKIKKMIYDLKSVSNYGDFINYIFKSDPFFHLNADYVALCSRNVSLAKGVL